MNADELLTKRDLFDFEQRLLAKLSNNQDGKRTKQYVRTKDIQKIFGISASTVQNLRNQGKISFQKIGGSIIYNVDEIESALVNLPGKSRSRTSKP
jgi:Mn-dependent DtxR family transcriptional regulator